MKSKFFILLILILFTLPTVIPFFNNRFFYTQDYIFIARLNQITAAVLDGNFPPRWAPDFRFGEPTFNFYAALPYYLGILIHFLGFDFIWVAKILFILSSILSALTMYILSEKLFGKKAAFLSAFLYVYAPYRAVDMYVRGALSEAWAFVFFPLIFYTAFCLSEKVNIKKIIYLSFSLAGLFLTHNVTSLMFLPFFILFTIYLMIKEKSKMLLFPFLLAFILGIGIASFFLLPAAYEKGFIQTDFLIVGYFDFRAHFVAYSQLFSTFWGYGSSVWGREDELSFQVGLGNWVILALLVIFGILKRKDKKYLMITLFIGMSFILSIFLQHNKSAFVWEAIPLMAFIQFPWRFLSISIFIVAIAGGLVTLSLKGKLNLLYYFLFIFVFFTTISYFKPKIYEEDSFFEKFTNKQIMQRGIDLTKDYLPIWVQTTDAKASSMPEAKAGNIDVKSFNKKTAFAESSINVLTNSEIVVPITYFPGWTVLSNGRIIDQMTPSEAGLIKFKLKPGDYNLKFEFRDTNVRIIGNVISFICIIGSLFILISRKIFKHV